jgi:hypothetical protein
MQIYVLISICVNMSAYALCLSDMYLYAIVRVYMQVKSGMRNKAPL